ncbi:MAG: bis-aminopropyl spermidine synthase family protein [Patescibacteria group bacterium]
MKEDDFLEKLAGEVGLTPKEAEGLLFLFKEPIENQKLIQETGLSKSILDDFRRFLSSYLEKPSRLTVLNSRGKKLVARISPKAFNWTPYWQQDFSPEEKEFLTKAKSFLANRPASNRSFDQFLATEETVLQRGLLLRRRGHIAKRRLIFLGDDDFTCLPVALLKEAKRILVVDIDKRILSAIREKADKEKLEIETLYYDLRQPLPSHLRANFDVVFTDPPYTPNGISLFLSRGIEALEAKNASVLYCCYGQSERAREKTLVIQEKINRMGLLVRERLFNFNRYFGASSIGSASSLYINSITAKTKPLIRGKYEGKIYTWEK